MKISQSLIKEVQKNDHCPRQIYYAFVEGKEFIEPSENMLLGRYFESELLGECRGGKKQPAKTKKNGEKYKVYSDVDNNIEFAKEVFNKLGIDLSKGGNQVFLESELLSGNIDHQNIDIENPDILANYDLKWTASKVNDMWNGWGDPETRHSDHIQAVHYTLISYEITGRWLPFYFLVFGKDNWVKIIRIQITEERINEHKRVISHTALKIREYTESNFKGNGNFNKCESCLFREFCPDRNTKPKIELIII